MVTGFDPALHVFHHHDVARTGHGEVWFCRHKQAEHLRFDRKQHRATAQLAPIGVENMIIKSVKQPGTARYKPSPRSSEEIRPDCTCTSTRHGRACPGHGDSDSEVFCGFPRTGNGSVTPLAYPIATPLSKRNKLRGGCIPRRKTLRDAHSHTTSKFCRLRDAVREHDDYGRIVLVRPAGAPRD